MLIKPPRLHPGDGIGIVAPASPPKDPEGVDRCIETVEQLGFVPKPSPHVRNRHGFLAGDDTERASDLMTLFHDPEVKAVFCVRGGYGCARILPLLDYDVIRDHPKIFLGYSDITSLHTAIYKNCEMVSFHGPNNLSLISQEPESFAVRMLLKTITSAEAVGSLAKDCPEPDGIRCLSPGRATGPLIGGNLAVLCAGIGTPFLPPFENCILFLEEVNEPPYKIDRCLTQLLNAGLLSKVNGVAIGICRHCEPPEDEPADEFRQSIQDVFEDRLGSLNVPVVMGLPFGHITDHATLPHGIRATLDADRGDLIIEEAAVL